MDTYEIFKLHLSDLLALSLPPEVIRKVLEAMDTLAQDFDITTKEKTLSVYQGDMPDALKLYLTAKAVEEKSKETLKLYRSVLRDMFRTVRKAPQDICTNDIRVYLYHRKQHGDKPVTIGNTRRILSGFFEWCTMEGLTPLNPVKRIAAIKAEKTPRKAMKRLDLEYLRQGCESLRDKALIDFLYSTGCRISEVANARIDCIDWEKKSVRIDHGKGNVTRFTYFNPECEVSLRAYLASRTDASPYIFARVRGQSDKPLTVKALQNAVRKLVMGTSYDFSTHITPHVFRHTVATVMLRNGMPVEQVQRFLGHTKIDTTLIYAEVGDDDVRRGHANFSA